MVYNTQDYWVSGLRPSSGILETKKNTTFSGIYIGVVIISRQCKIFLFSTASRPTLGPTQPPIQWVTGGDFPGDKAAGA
jgi:hypothetical protein